MTRETYYVVIGEDDDGETFETRFESLRQARRFAAATAKKSGVPADVHGFWSPNCGQIRYMPDGSVSVIS